MLRHWGGWLRRLLLGGRRRDRLFVGALGLGRGWAGLGLLTALACSTSTPSGQSRAIEVVSWDTLFFHPLLLHDALLAEPYAVERWGDHLVVADYVDQRLVLLDLTGTPAGVLGGKGRGPGEFEWIRDLHVTDDDRLLVLDAGNRRITEYLLPPSSERSIFHGIDDLSGTPWSLISTDSRVIISLLSAARDSAARALVLDDAMAVVDEVRFPWKSAIPQGTVMTGRLVRRPGSPSEWVYVLSRGPGFATFRNLDGEPHSYIHDVPFQNSASAAGDSDAGWHGAVAVTATQNSIFTLAGGRPQRRAHDLEPTVHIDVYRWDGSYRHSLLLPGHTSDLAVRGDTIYVIQRQPHYGILALRPSPSQPTR